MVGVMIDIIETYLLLQCITAPTAYFIVGVKSYMLFPWHGRRVALPLQTERCPIIVWQTLDELIIEVLVTALLAFIFVFVVETHTLFFDE